MPLLQIHLLERLGHDDAKLFEQGIAELGKWRRDVNDDQTVGAALEVLSALNVKQSLSASERSRRTRLLLEVLSISNAKGLQTLAEAARTWNAELKIAVARSVPPPLRRLVYSAVLASAPPPGDTVVAKSANPTQPRSDANQAVVPHFRTVLLLGAQQDHEFNDQHLRRHNFDPLRVDRPEQLEDLLNETVCAIVIAKSWWAVLPQAEHRKFIETILQHSTFTWVKLDQTGLVCVPPIALQDLYRSIRFADTPQLAIGDTCRITDYDIENFRRAGRFISTSVNAQLTPGDVRGEEGNVLLAATAHCVDARHFPASFQLERVPVGLIAGGHSDAKIFRVEPDDGGIPFIEKMDAIDRLRDEMERFCTFVRPWDDRLKPCLHFHAGKGVIVFTLVDNPGSPGQPAPTFEDRLRSVMFGEIWGAGQTVPNESDLGTTISRAIDKLTRLNSQPCSVHALPSHQWLDCNGLDALLKCGVVWKIPAGKDGTTDALGVRAKATEIVKRLIHRAIIHGDAHLRNVLVRDDREPYFIDYAYSGPGHPCFDLVRFESALFFQFFRMTDGEYGIRELLLNMLRDDLAEAEIQKRFPDLTSSIGNRLAVKAMVLSRRACVEVLKKYNGGFSDYIAVKYIVACQSLTLPHLQAGIVRGALSALSDLLE